MVMITKRGALAAGAAICLPGLVRAAAEEPTAAPPGASPLLGKIRAVTTTASDLDAIRSAYENYLGYRVVERGRVSSETAKGWGAPATAGKHLLIMAPPAGEATLLRFVQQDQPAGFRPMTTFGWNATEIIVQNSDRVAERLEHSPFRVVAPPRDLDGNPDIRAMQAIGPANEMLYLTSLKRPLPGRDMPTAEAFVGRCFIVVAGGADMAAMAAFYLDAFGRPTSKPFNSRISSLSAQNGLPPETRYDLAVTQLGGGTKLELDQYPATAGPRPRPPGGLPAGMAMVSFDCSAFDRFLGRMIAPPAAAGLGLSRGRRAGVVTGAAGELIELVET